MSTCKTVKTWTKTSIGNLVKHRSGGYYARLFIGGKERWKTLRTKVLEVAKARLREEQRDAGKMQPVAQVAKSGRMTMNMAIEQLLAELGAHVAMPASKKTKIIKNSSADYRRETVTSLRKTWRETHGADIGLLEVRKVTQRDVERWANAMREKAAFSRFNNTLGTLRRLFDIAIAAGELHHNPTQHIARSTKAVKDTYTPTRADFTMIVETIRSSPSRLADDAADYVEFLGCTGARKNEAAEITWGDVDLARGRVTFRETKNSKNRTNRMIPQAVALLQRLHDERGECDPADRVFRVSEAYGSLRAAAGKIGIPRISHHDLRDFFATTAIECGADIPTVADWLGHLDGGKLLLDTYRKHRDEHEQNCAGMISLAAEAPAQNIIAMKGAVA